jgi:hypothetical protein
VEKRAAKLNAIVSRVTRRVQDPAEWRRLFDHGCVPHRHALMATGALPQTGGGVFAGANWRSNRSHKGFKFRKSTQFVRICTSMNSGPCLPCQLCACQPELVLGLISCLLGFSEARDVDARIHCATCQILMKTCPGEEGWPRPKQEEKHAEIWSVV